MTPTTQNEPVGSSNSQFRARLKKYSWLVLVLSSIVWGCKSIEISNLDRQAAPIIGQLSERHSGPHLATMLIGSIVSVVSGENITAIANALDQWFGDDPLNQRLAPILHARQGAMFWKNTAWWAGLIALSLIGFEYWGNKGKVTEETEEARSWRQWGGTVEFLSSLPHRTATIRAGHLQVGTASAGLVPLTGTGLRLRHQ